MVSDSSHLFPKASRFNKNHSAKDGKFTNGIGVDVGDIEKKLHKGEKISVSPNKVDALMNRFADGTVFNLNRMQVTGEGNENVFGRHARDIARADMPQLSARRGEWKAFSDQLAERGIEGTAEEVDPRSLMATQNELDAVKVGQMYRDVKNGTMDPTKGALFVDRNGAVLDGHHRWAGMAAAKITGTDIKVPVLRVMADIDELLEIAQSVSGPRKGLAA